jgi:hypothetical protein
MQMLLYSYLVDGNVSSSPNLFCLFYYFRQNLIMEHLNIPQPEKMADRGSIRPVMG